MTAMSSMLMMRTNAVLIVVAALFLASEFSRCCSCENPNPWNFSSPFRADSRPVLDHRFFASFFCVAYAVAPFTLLVLLPVGIFTYFGSDEPWVSGGRPFDNDFYDNTIQATETGVKIKDSDNISIQSKTRAVCLGCRPSSVSEVYVRFKQVLHHILP